MQNRGMTLNNGWTRLEPTAIKHWSFVGRLDLVQSPDSVFTAPFLRRAKEEVFIDWTKSRTKTGPDRLREGYHKIGSTVRMGGVGMVSSKARTV